VSRWGRGDEGRDAAFVDVNGLTNSIEGHVDLQVVEAGKRVECIVSLFVPTGCDFVSFISGISKTNFLKNFYH
jgi:hypothetical protein